MSNRILKIYQYFTLSFRKRLKEREREREREDGEWNEFDDVHVCPILQQCAPLGVPLGGCRQWVQPRVQALRQTRPQRKVSHTFFQLFSSLEPFQKSTSNRFCSLFSLKSSRKIKNISEKNVKFRNLNDLSLQVTYLWSLNCLRHEIYDTVDEIWGGTMGVQSFEWQLCFSCVEVAKRLIKRAIGCDLSTPFLDCLSS